MSSSPTVSRLRIIPKANDFLDRNVGASGEIFFNRATNSLRVYSGQERGGFEIARADLENVSTEGLKQAAINSGVATVVYRVTIQGPQGSDVGNKYVLNDVYRLEPNFVVGYTYVFIQDDLTNVYFPNANGTTPNPHPLNFSADNLSGERGGGTSYLDGVKYFLNGELVDQSTYVGAAFNTATSRRVQITITADTPSELFYWCYNHLAMGNRISVAEPGSGTGGTGVEISNAVPGSPTVGDLWWDSTDGNLYIYYDDGDSQQWVSAFSSIISAGLVTSADLIGLATESYVDQAVTDLVAGAPETLNTLNALAAALGNDADFATTVTNLISEKAPINSPTFTGTVSGVTATMVGLGNVTNESKATMFTSPTFTGATGISGGITVGGLATLQQTTEVLNNLTGATGTVVHNFSTGAIWVHTSMSANFTANFTNVPTTDNRAISVALVLVQGATARIPNAVQIDGAAQTILWQDNIVPTGNANKRDLVNFTLIRTGSTWTVLGSLSTYG
jgi:hypothetical protein